jgi:hypothetical protein
MKMRPWNKMNGADERDADLERHFVSVFNGGRMWNGYAKLLFLSFLFLAGPPIYRTLTLYLKLL